MNTPEFPDGLLILTGEIAYLDRHEISCLTVVDKPSK